MVKRAKGFIIHDANASFYSTCFFPRTKRMGGLVMELSQFFFDVATETSSGSNRDVRSEKKHASLVEDLRLVGCSSKWSRFLEALTANNLEMELANDPVSYFNAHTTFQDAARVF